MKIRSAKFPNRGKGFSVQQVADLWSILLKDTADETAYMSAGADEIGLWKRFSEGY